MYKYIILVLMTSLVVGQQYTECNGYNGCSDDSEFCNEVSLSINGDKGNHLTITVKNASTTAIVCQSYIYFADYNTISNISFHLDGWTINGTETTQNFYTLEASYSETYVDWDLHFSTTATPEEATSSNTSTSITYESCNTNSLSSGVTSGSNYFSIQPKIIELIIHYSKEGY